MYQEYLARSAHVDARRDYAKSVAKATSGASMTPVEPLATMGKNGGPLLCDVCGEPMILEGGNFNRVFADAAWEANPVKGWNSYISGGMVVLIESNNTLRVYHGYIERSGCVLIAEKDNAKAKADFRASAASNNASAKLGQISAYLKAELPEKSSDAVLSDIYRVLFSYDPGPGINSPT